MNNDISSKEVTLIANIIASDCVGARIRILNRAISRIYDEAVRPHNIKFSQLNMLTVITLHEPIQQGDVGRILSLEKSTLSRNVSLMEAKGWIQSLPGDGNNRLLSVTSKGQQLLKDAASDWLKAQEHVTAMLGEQTTIEIRQAANRIWQESS
ncbi:MAG: MarR family transcriptional regulator [Cyanobacteria bacterium P01_A01_bin.37]